MAKETTLRKCVCGARPKWERTPCIAGQLIYSLYCDREVHKAIMSSGFSKEDVARHWNRRMKRRMDRRNAV